MITTKFLIITLLVGYELLEVTTAGINPPECGKRINERSNRIVGGQKAAPKDWGWQVLISYDNGEKSFMCGGSLINSDWVLSAAHCVNNLVSGNNTQPSYYTLSLGLHNRSNPEPSMITLQPSKIIIHPEFNDKNLQTEGFQNDIALFKLNESVTFTDTILPVCLPELNSKYDNMMAWVTGWGSLYGGGPASNYLMEVNIPTYNDSFCRTFALTFNFNLNTDNSICAGNQNKGTCQGDSGGPLVVKDNGKWKIVGIPSFVPTSCNIGGVFTRTSNFIDWITQEIEENSSTIPVRTFGIIYLCFFLFPNIY